MTFFIKRILHLLIVIQFLALQPCIARDSKVLLEKGWQALVRDNDTLAVRFFSDAYTAAVQANDTAGKARALLYLGIGTYGVSYSKGLVYAHRAMEVYQTMAATDPAMAREGRSRCLLLISTIANRQGNYSNAILLGREALKGLEGHKDTTGSLGLVYNNLGNAYQKLNRKDSAGYFFGLSIKEHLRSGNMTYLPSAYMQMARLEVERGNKAASYNLYKQALRLADSTGNRQAQVSAWIGIGHWQKLFENNMQETELSFLKAMDIAQGLTDKTFSLQANESLLALYKETGDYRKALTYQENIESIRNSLYAWDRQKEIKDIEIQYKVAETDRRLAMANKQRERTLRINYLLWGGIVVLALLSAWIIVMLRSIHKKDQWLLRTKEDLVKATEQQRILLETQKQLKEQHMQQELELKESQLTAMTLQMMQKNELMQELKTRLEEDNVMHHQGLHKIINKGLNQDKEWSDFNLYFESMNRHFYSRIKEAYPDISPNDLKICALIKLHLSIKEMAVILNISPDSVKTARYRLRKKLQLHNEDNLTDFIMAL